MLLSLEKLKNVENMLLSNFPFASAIVGGIQILKFNSYCLILMQISPSSDHPQFLASQFAWFECHIPGEADSEKTVVFNPTVLLFQHSCHSFLVKLRRHFLTAEYLNRNEHRLLDLGRRLAGNNGSRNGRRHWNGRLEVGRKMAKVSADDIFHFQCQNSVANGAEDNAAGGSTISQSILRFFSSMWWLKWWISTTWSL